MLDLRQFEALRALAENGSVAAAARALGWSQPTVAYHLKTLGADLGAAVVTATPAGTVLTKAGRLWLPHAEAVLGRVARARDEVLQGVQSGRRTARVGIFPTAAARVLPHLVTAAAGTDISLQIVEAEVDVLLRRLKEMSLEAAIVFSPVSVPPVIPEPVRLVELARERYRLMLGAERRVPDEPVDLACFAHEPWVLGTRDVDPGDEVLRDAANRAGFDVLAGPRTDDYRVVRAYAAAGLGVALVPELSFSGVHHDVRMLRLADDALVRQIWLVTESYLPDDIQQFLIDTVRGTLTQERRES